MLNIEGENMSVADAIRTMYYLLGIVSLMLQLSKQ